MDLREWRVFGVKLDVRNGARMELDGPVYMVSRDGRSILSPNMARIRQVQGGYGVILPPEKVPANDPATDGVFLTDAETGRCRLLVSMGEILETAEPRFDPGRFRNGEWFGFHVKWNPQGDRVMFVMRWKPNAKEIPARRCVITMLADGSDIRCAITDDQWLLGGHHPEWCPDGVSLTMNLRLEQGGPLRFVRARYDGGGFKVLGSMPGSGHPTLHPDGRHLLTDVYLHERELGYGDGTTPLRWIDLQSGEEKRIVRINNDPPWPGPRKELRIDPHPAWDRRYRYVTFNGCDRGARRVYIADLGGLLPESG